MNIFATACVTWPTCILFLICVQWLVLKSLLAQDCPPSPELRSDLHRFISKQDDGRSASRLGERSVYTAPSEEAALAALNAFEEKWSEKYPAIAPLWRKDWERLTPFFDYAPAIQQGGLHHQCDRIAELQPAQNRQGAGRFPQRRRGAQAALPGSARSVEEMEASHTRLEGRTQPVRHTLWRQSPH